MFIPDDLRIRDRPCLEGKPLPYLKPIMDKDPEYLATNYEVDIEELKGRWNCIKNGQLELVPISHASGVMEILGRIFPCLASCRPNWILYTWVFICVQFFVEDVLPTQFFRIPGVRMEDEVTFYHLENGSCTRKADYVHLTLHMPLAHIAMQICSDQASA